MKKTFIILLMTFLMVSCGQKKAWENAKAKKTIEAYENYLNQFPEGKYVDLANSSLEKLYWQEAITLDSVPIYENFISKYPNSRNNTLAIEKLEVKKDEIFYSRCKRVNKFRSNSHSGYMAVDNEGSGSALQNWLNDAMGVTLLISGGGSIHGHLVEKEYGVVLFSDYGKIYAHNINDEEGVWGRACECDIKLLEQLYIEIKNNSYKNQIIRELKNIGTERAFRALKRIKEKQE